MMLADADLLRRWSEGDAGAGAELVQRHSTRIHRYLMRRFPEQAEDLLQETFLACMEGAHRFRERASVRTYLQAIAMHHVHAQHRRARRASAAALLECAAVEASDVGTACVSLSRLELARMLADAMSKLPPELRTILYLTYWDELAQQDVAKRLRLPLGTVASRLRRAKARIRMLMNINDEEATPESR
jgi:RNA polymerase sigma-70 factor (ECF subfamily)